MLVESVELFVPGRLCVLGEHSDWMADYPEVGRGATLVCCTNEGIFATAVASASGFSYTSSSGLRFESACDVARLEASAAEGWEPTHPHTRADLLV